MKTLKLGKTGLVVTKTAMGCLPVQRCSVEDGVRLLRAAFDGGIRYFDTANAYTDSEMKIGLALADVRDQIVLSTKSMERTKAGVLAHIENSLKMMKTDHVDLFQFHQVPETPDPDDPDGAYAGALEAKARGWITASPSRRNASVRASLRRYSSRSATFRASATSPSRRSAGPPTWASSP